MKVLSLILLFILISMIDLPAIAKKTKDKIKYFVVYGIIILGGFTISILQVIDKAPVSPSKVIEIIIKGIIGGI